MKKPLLLQHHFPFLPRPSFFPGHRILPRSQQKHHPIVPPGLLGLVVFHSTVPSLYKASYGCILSGNASSFQEGLWFSCVPGLLLGLLCPPSASAASTNLILRWGGDPQEKAWKKRTLHRVYLYITERLPCSEIQPLNTQGVGGPVGYNSELGQDHFPSPLFRKIWPPHNSMRLTLVKIINYNLVPELYMVMQHRSDFKLRLVSGKLGGPHTKTGLAILQLLRKCYKYSGKTSGGR